MSNPNQQPDEPGEQGEGPSSQSFNFQQDPLFVVPLPNGKFLNVPATIESQKGQETQLVMSYLRPNDIVAFQYDNPDNPDVLGFSFEVSEVNWKGLNILDSGEVRAVVRGTLNRGLSHDPSARQDVLLNGSGFGGSVMNLTEISSGRSIYFSSRSMGEWRSPLVSHFQVFRVDNQGGRFKALSPQDVRESSGSKNEQHLNRLQKFQQLQELFGFKDKITVEDSLGNEQGVVQTYEGTQLLAALENPADDQSRLVVFDKNTKQLWQLVTDNRNGNNVFQLGRIDLSMYNPNTITPGFMMNYFGLRALGLPTITYTTSPAFGMSAVSFTTGPKKARH